MAIDIYVVDDQNITHSTYTVEFDDDFIITTVTHDPDVVTEWIRNIERIHHRRLFRLVVGLDIEWRPNFGTYSNNKAATLQLCVGRRCLIFQLMYTHRIPDSLTTFLSNDHYTFVGVGIESDLEKLQEDHEFGYNVKSVDLRALAAAEYQRNDLKRAGLKGLSAVVLDREVEKPRNVTLSRWDSECLTFAQIQYACIDAFLSFEIGRFLNASN